MANEDGHVRDIKIPEFHGDSYLEIPLRRRVEKTLEFQIWLLVEQPNGRLLCARRIIISFSSNIMTRPIACQSFCVLRIPVCQMTLAVSQPVGYYYLRPTLPFIIII